MPLPIGYARVCTDAQDLTAQRDALAGLGVTAERSYVDHRLTGTKADLIRLRTREGMKVARAKGRMRGKQPKLNPRQKAHLVALHHAEEHSTAELDDLFGVARSTVYRAIQRETARADSSAAGSETTLHR